MSHSVYQVILDTIEKVSTGQLFGVFGDAINPLADALAKEKGKRFEWIGVRHEEVAAYAAGAQAKLTGKLGICAATVGPGAIHLLNGLYDAKMDHAPVLAITGQVPRDEIGSDYHQEVNLDRLFDDVSVYNQTVYSLGQLPRLISLATQTALAESGIAHLSIPSDIGGKNIDDLSLAHPIVQAQGARLPSEENLRLAAEHINSATNITLFIGWGARGSTHEIKTLATKLKAPVVHALKGKAVLDESDPYWVGGTGFVGNKGGVHALESCDVLLMLGTDFPYRQFYPEGKHIIQVDINPARLGKRVGIAQGLVGHVKETVNALTPLVNEKTNTKHLEHAQEKRDHWFEHLAKPTLAANNDKLIHPQYLAHLISEHASDSALFTADTGETIVWMARYIKMLGQRDFIASFNHASMANALAQAIGLQALDKSRQVIAMCGDGGFSMLMGDFITAVSYELPIKVFVFNNSALGLVRLEMQSTGFIPWGIDLKNPNFAECAKAMGAEGLRVNNGMDLPAAVKRAFEIEGPVLVDVKTNTNEVIWPPKMVLDRAWGFSISKIKEVLHNFE